MNNNDIAFFIGLLEGDGSIQVNHWREKYLQFRVVIKLKYTEKNHEMLSEIRNQLDMFNIHVRNNWVLLVEDNQQKLKRFIKLVNLFGGLLLTKCRKRFCFFEYALVNKITFSEYIAIKNNPIWFGYNNIKPFNVNELINRAYFNEWLIGFFEAESCFCIRKNNNHSFYNPVLPNPPAPLSVSTNSSTSCNSFVNILSKINCAILSPVFIVKSYAP